MELLIIPNILEFILVDELVSRGDPEAGDNFQNILKAGDIRNLKKYSEKSSFMEKELSNFFIHLLYSNNIQVNSDLLSFQFQDSLTFNLSEQKINLITNLSEDFSSNGILNKKTVTENHIQDLLLIHHEEADKMETGDPTAKEIDIESIYSEECGKTLRISDNSIFPWESNISIKGDDSTCLLNDGLIQNKILSQKETYPDRLFDKGDLEEIRIKIENLDFEGIKDSFIKPSFIPITGNDEISNVFSRMIFQDRFKHDFESKKISFLDSNHITPELKEFLNQNSNLEKEKVLLDFNRFKTIKDFYTQDSILPGLKEGNNEEEPSIIFGIEGSMQKRQDDIGDGMDLGDFQNMISEHHEPIQSNTRPPSDLPNIDYKEIYQQIEKKVVWCLKNDKEKVKLILNPPELGHIQIEVKNSQKNVEIMLWAEHADTKQLLELNRELLSSILSEDGFKLERLSIYFHQEMMGFQDRNENPLSREKRFLKSNQEDEELDIVHEERMIGSYGLNQSLYGVKHIDLRV